MISLGLDTMLIGPIYSLKKPPLKQFMIFLRIIPHSFHSFLHYKVKVYM